tara:strand:+ start:74 stop:193 length:120 start_codon:yes stop_codon:yes gene_type:complete
MIRYISLLLFIGLAFLGCEEEPEIISKLRLVIAGALDND